MLLTRLFVFALAATSTHVAPVPSVRFFTQTDIRRWPGFGDDTWARATLELHFDVQPRAGQEILVIPLRIPVAPFRLPIRNVEPQQFEACDGETIETIYHVETDDLPDPALRTLPALPGRRDEFPFDAAVLYPAVPKAKVVPPGQIRLTQVPKGVLLSQITLALDLNGDGSPDLLIVTYDQGDATIEDYWEKTGANWHRSRHLVPC